MYRKFLLGMLACGVAGATEQFEGQPAGGFTSVKSAYGTLTAQAGHAEINRGHGRNSAQALRVLGGENRSVTLTLSKALDVACEAQCWVERWTGRNPFSFRILAVTPEGEKEVAKLEKSGVGGYHNQLKWTIPAGATALRFVANTAAGGGVLIDDLTLMVGPMSIKKVSFRDPGVFPIMKRAAFNPVLAVEVESEGAANPKAVGKVSLKVSDPSRVESVTLRSGDATGLEFRSSKEYGKGVPLADGTVVSLTHEDVLQIFAAVKEWQTAVQTAKQKAWQRIDATVSEAEVTAALAELHSTLEQLNGGEEIF